MDRLATVVPQGDFTLDFRPDSGRSRRTGLVGRRRYPEVALRTKGEVECQRPVWEGVGGCQGTGGQAPNDMRRTGRTRVLLDEIEVGGRNPIVVSPTEPARGLILRVRRLRASSFRPELARRAPRPGTRSMGPPHRSHGHQENAPSSIGHRREGRKALRWSGWVQKTPGGVIQAFQFCGMNCDTSSINHCFYWLNGGEGVPEHAVVQSTRPLRETSPNPFV